MYDFVDDFLRRDPQLKGRRVMGNESEADLDRGPGVGVGVGVGLGLGVLKALTP